MSCGAYESSIHLFLIWIWIHPPEREKENAGSAMCAFTESAQSCSKAILDVKQSSARWLDNQHTRNHWQEIALSTSKAVQDRLLSALTVVSWRNGVLKEKRQDRTWFTTVCCSTEYPLNWLLLNCNKLLYNSYLLIFWAAGFKLSGQLKTPLQ